DAATAAACGGQHILRPEQCEPPIGAQLIKCAWRCRRMPTVARSRDTPNPNWTVRGRDNVVNRPERVPSDTGEGHSAVTGTDVRASWEGSGASQGEPRPRERLRHRHPHGHRVRLYPYLDPATGSEVSGGPCEDASAGVT